MKERGREDLTQDEGNSQTLDDLWQFEEEEIRHGLEGVRREAKRILGTDIAESLTYAVLCAIVDGVNTREDLHRHLDDMFAFRLRRVSLSSGDIDEAIQHGLYEKLITTSNGHFSLTDHGYRLLKNGRWHLMHTGYWISRVFEEKIVLGLSAFFLVFLILVKLWVGLSIHSQAMITDGLENLTDLVVVGIIGLSLHYKKDRLGAIAIMIFMLFSGATLAYRGILAFIENATVEVNIWGFAVAGLSLVINFAMIYYKTMAGRMSGNLAFVSDAKEDGTHLKTGGGVIVGLAFAIFNIHFVDSIVAIVIAGFIVWEGIEALRELRSAGEEFSVDTINLGASDYFEDIIVYWVLNRLTRGPVSMEQLNEDFLHGVRTGYRYYNVHAILGYNRLEEKGIMRNIQEAIRNDLIEKKDGELSITRLGLAAYYKNRAKELSLLADSFANTRPSLWSVAKAIIVLATIILFFQYADAINALLAEIPSLLP